MHANKQPSIKNLLLSGLTGCVLIVLVGVGLSLYSRSQAENENKASPELAAAIAPDTLVMLTEIDKAEAFALNFAKKIDRLQNTVEQFDVKNYTSQLTGVHTALNEFDSWASFIGEGVALNLSADASIKLKTLYDTIERVQQKSLPALRDQYGPLIRAEFAKLTPAKSAMTIGNGYKTLLLTGTEFKDEEAVDQFHTANLELFINMRFDKITYRARKGDRKPTIKSIGENADKLLIDWTSHETHGALGVEQLFSAINHKEPAETETADAEIAQ